MTWVRRWMAEHHTRWEVAGRPVRWAPVVAVILGGVVLWWVRRAR